MFKKLFYVLVITGFVFTQVNCGTISNSMAKGDEKDKRPVYLYNCPSDARVTFNGSYVEITNHDYVKYQVTSYTTISMPSVMLPYKTPGELTISSSMGTKSIKLEPKLWGWSTLGNCCFPVYGHAIDYFTKNDRTLKPNIIDVKAFLSDLPKSQWTKP